MFESVAMEGSHPTTTSPPSQGGEELESLTFMSDNSTGANTIKSQWVRDIAREYGVTYCGIQEHFKTVKSTNNWFKKQFRSFHTYVIPAYRLAGVDNGRGKGGLAQLSSRDFSKQKMRVATKSPRLQAQILSFPTCEILWINCYFPCDPPLQHFDDTEPPAFLH